MAGKKKVWKQRKQEKEKKRKREEKGKQKKKMMMMMMMLLMTKEERMVWEWVDALSQWCDRSSSGDFGDALSSRKVYVLRGSSRLV